MDVQELKFLIKLITQADYRAKFGEITILKSAEKNRACRSLKENNYIDLIEKIDKLRITDAGKILLTEDSSNLPITPEEYKAIKAFSKQDILSPGKTNTKPDKRNEIISSLIDKGFLEAIKILIKEVWLTEEGKKFLATESSFNGGGNITFSKKMFADYLGFIRNYYAKSAPAQISTNGKIPAVTTTEKPTDEDILNAIVDLDSKLATDNYLPIFHLRNQLQPPLSREELDNALYRLQNDDKIELSKLAEVTLYTREQIDAGIPQLAGGSWFFIMVND